MGTPLIGVLQIAMMASSSALFADLVPSEHRGKVSGITGFFTNIAMAFGQLAGGMMYDNFSHSLPWIVQVIFIIPILVIIILYIDEPQKEKEEN
jgi:MFS family permease